MLNNSICSFSKYCFQFIQTICLYQTPIKQSQARSQGEARKPGFQHHIGLDARNPDFVDCEYKDADQPAQSDQRLCYSLFEK